MGTCYYYEICPSDGERTAGEKMRSRLARVCLAGALVGGFGIRWRAVQLWELLHLFFHLHLLIY